MKLQSVPAVLTAFRGQDLTHGIKSAEDQAALGPRTEALESIAAWDGVIDVTRLLGRGDRKRYLMLDAFNPALLSRLMARGYVEELAPSSQSWGSRFSDLFDEECQPQIYSLSLN